MPDAPRASSSSESSGGGTVKVNRAYCYSVGNEHLRNATTWRSARVLAECSPRSHGARVGPGSWLSGSRTAPLDAAERPESAVLSPLEDEWTVWSSIAAMASRPMSIW